MSRTAALPEPDRLERLVTVIDGAVADEGWQRPHLLVAIEQERDDGTFKLCMREFDEGAHPVDELLGCTAPPSWIALGAVTYGWAAPIDCHASRPSEHPERCRARVTSIVDRDGREAVTTTLEDGRVIDEPGLSVLADVLRRCLGAPTAPPPPFRELRDVLWLEAVLASPVGIHRWTDVLALRPHGTTWTKLRHVAAGAPGFGQLATWMDDGMFARWLLGGHRSLHQLLADVEARLPRAIAQRLRAQVS